MRYENGKDIFPEALLKQIQKYASGKLVYIPSKEKKPWGETSGYRQYLAERNQRIRQGYSGGETIDALADRFCLSPESIRRIVYSKKEGLFMQYGCSLTSAKAFAKEGKLEEWVHRYLLSDGGNRDFSDGLKLFDRYFLGPMELPLALFERCCGPEENMRYRVDAAWFERHVSELAEVIRRNPDMPPLIVHFLNDQGTWKFELNDGNHRFEAYRRMGYESMQFIVWITEESELREFERRYGSSK